MSYLDWKVSQAAEKLFEVDDQLARMAEIARRSKDPQDAERLVAIRIERDRIAATLPKR